MSGFLDGSEFHTLRSHVPLNDMESFVYEDNMFTVTDGWAVFHEEVSPVGSSSFNEYVLIAIWHIQSTLALATCFSMGHQPSLFLYQLLPGFSPCYLDWTKL